MQRAGILLQDEDHTRWGPAELRLWINEGCKAVVAAKPSAKASTRVLTLAEGTRQTVPAAAGLPVPIQLLDITANVSAESPVRLLGRSIKIVGRAQLDANDPYWQDKTRTRFKKEVRHFVFDEQNPLEFVVYPGNDGTGKVEGVIATVPAELAAGADPADATTYTGTIDLPEIYDPALVDYVCYRSFLKDATSGDPGLAATYYQSFAAALGIKIQVEGGSSPNARRGKP